METIGTAKEKFLKTIILGHFRPLKLLKNIIKSTGLLNNTPLNIIINLSLIFHLMLKLLKKNTLT